MESHHKAWLIGSITAILALVTMILILNHNCLMLDEKYIEAGYTRNSVQGSNGTWWVKQ